MSSRCRSHLISDLKWRALSAYTVYVFFLLNFLYRSNSILKYSTSTAFLFWFDSVIDLPATDGSVIEREVIPSHVSTGKLTYYGPQMPTSAIAGLSDERAERFVVLPCTPLQL